MRGLLTRARYVPSFDSCAAPSSLSRRDRLPLLRRHRALGCAAPRASDRDSGSVSPRNRRRRDARRRQARSRWSESPLLRRTPCCTTCERSGSTSCSRAAWTSTSSIWSWRHARPPRWACAKRLSIRTCPWRSRTGSGPTAFALHPDANAVASRRRVKSAAELAGIRRAQAAAEAGMRAAAALLGRATPKGEQLMLAGLPLTAEAVRAVLRDECRRQRCPRSAGRDRCLRLAGNRSRSRLGPPAGEPADPGRRLAVRRGVRLLGGHDPNLRRRRGKRGRSRPRRRSCAGRSRRRGGRAARSAGRRAARHRLRHLRSRRVSDPANRPGRERPGRGLPVLARPRGRASGARGSQASGRAATRSWSPAT